MQASVEGRVRGGHQTQPSVHVALGGKMPCDHNLWVFTHFLFHDSPENKICLWKNLSFFSTTPLQQKNRAEERDVYCGGED